MRDEVVVFDADGHVIEPSDLWDRHIDREYYGVRPICDPGITDENIVVMGKGMSRTGMLQPGEEYDIAAWRAAVVGDWIERFPDHLEGGSKPEIHLRDMDVEGIDTMALYPSRGLYAASVSDLDGGVSAAICRAYNRWLHDFCSKDPGRLLGVALGALHDPERAAEEARYAVEELGLAGVMVRPNPYAGRNLDHPANDVFFAEVARLGVPLATHEGSGVWMPQYGERYRSRFAQHAMCHPMEQMGAVWSFTAGGIMERHPTLKVAILEAGAGWLPSWLHRLDEHYEWLAGVEAETGALTMKPSAYFARQGWIGAEADEPGLRCLVDTIGADRILWASDYPHPDATFPGAVDKLLAADGLTRDELAAYAGGNAAALYGRGDRQPTAA